MPYTEVRRSFPMYCCNLSAQIKSV